MTSGEDFPFSTLFRMPVFQKSFNNWGSQRKYIGKPSPIGKVRLARHSPRGRSRLCQTGKMTLLLSILAFAVRLKLEEMKVMSSGYADVNGIKLYHEIYHQGEPLVLIHGGLTTIGEMRGWAQPLAKTRRVIAVEMQGATVVRRTRTGR